MAINDPNWPANQDRAARALEAARQARPPGGDFTDRRNVRMPLAPEPAGAQSPPQSTNPYPGLLKAIEAGGRELWSRRPQREPTMIEARTVMPHSDTLNRRAGLSRVVKKADGSYTDLPGAEGEVRYYDAMGNRADRGDTPAGTDLATVNRQRYDSIGRVGAGMKRRGGDPVVRQFYADQQAAPALDMAATRANGRTALALSERKAQENAPKLTVEQMEKLANINKTNAEAADIGAKRDTLNTRAEIEARRYEMDKDKFEREALLEQNNEFNQLSEQLGSRAQAFDAWVAAGRDPRAVTLGGLESRERAQQLGRTVNDYDNWLARLLSGRDGTPYGVGRAAIEDPALDASQFEFEELGGINGALQSISPFGEDRSVLRYNGPVAEGFDTPSRIISAEERARLEPMIAAARRLRGG